MSVTATINALQALHRAISVSVNGQAVQVTAPDLDAYPLSLPTAQLPMVLLWPGPASHYLEGVNVARSDRVYVVRWYVAPLGQNTLGAAIPVAAALMDAARDRYLVPNGLNLAGDAVNTMVVEANEGDITDIGFRSDLAYGETLYRGFEFRVRIYEKTETDE